MNSMKVEELDCGNCEIARFHGKEADVKSVSPRTETCYQADGMDELAQHSEVQSSVPEVKHGVVRRNNTFLPGEASSRAVPVDRPRRGMIPGESGEESAEVIVVFDQPGAFTRPDKRRNRKSGRA
jgi:hypothetical protein